MVYFDLVSSLEVVNHIASSLLIAVIKDIVLGIHIPLDTVNFVGTVRAVPGHHDSSFEFSVHVGLVMSQHSIFY